MNRLGRRTLTKGAVVPLLLHRAAPAYPTRSRLLLALFVLASITAWAQEAIPLAPNEPIAPTSPDECVAFNNAYTKVIDIIAEARLKCIDAHPTGHFDTVGAPMSCIEGGWAGGKSTVMRACARIEDQWCRATTDRQKKFDACMSEVEENKKKKDIAEGILLGNGKKVKDLIGDAIQGKKPVKGASDDEIDLAFLAVGAAAKPKQNEVVGAIQDAGLGILNSLEKDAFSELDKAFRDADFAELTRASQPRPAPQAPALISNRRSEPEDPGAILHNTVWTSYDQNGNSFTLRFGSGREVTMDYFRAGEGSMPSDRGTWELQGGSINIQWEDRDLGSESFRLIDGSSFERRGGVYRKTGKKD